MSLTITAGYRLVTLPPTAESCGEESHCRNLRPTSGAQRGEQGPLRVRPQRAAHPCAPAVPTLRSPDRQSAGGAADWRRFSLQVADFLRNVRGLADSFLRAPNLKGMP